MRSRVLALVQDLVPGLSPVVRPEYTPIGVWPKRMSQRGDVHDIRIFRMNPYLAYMTSIPQTDVLPRAPGICRAVDAVTVRDVVADAAFARPDVDHVWIRIRNGDRTHRRGPKEAIGDVVPV